MGFKSHIPVILALARATENTPTIFPLVLYAFIPNVALGVIERCHRIDAVGVFAAVYAAPRKQTGQLGNGDAIKLMLKNMIDALLQVGQLRLQPFQQPFGDLPQENAGFASRVKKSGLGALEQFLRQQIQHLVGDFRRREDLVVGQVRQTG